MGNISKTSKRPRKARMGSAAVAKARTEELKSNRAEKLASRGRRSPVVADFPGLLFLRHQKEHRWPTQQSEEKYANLNMDRNRHTSRGPSTKKIKPAKMGFTLLDAVLDKGKNLDILLTAAALKLKKVRRYPGYVLIRTYNLKNRPIEII